MTREEFDAVNAARDKALVKHRLLIRTASLAIRAAHRGEMDEARSLVEKAGKEKDELNELVKDYPRVAFAGFCDDAHKEYAEALITINLIEGKDLPGPDEINVKYAPYLNGLAEAVGELRRFVIDRIRTSNPEDGERVLDDMVEIYYLLTAIDYPDWITRGLRRSTDVARTLIEKTRSELAASISQHRLVRALEKVRKVLKIAKEPISLETPIGEEEDSHLGDFIEDNGYQHPEEEIMEKSLKNDINVILRTLTEKESEIIQYRFGLNGRSPLSLKEIGDRYHLTKERIRQIEKKALKRLQHPSRSQLLSAYTA